MYRVLRHSIVSLILDRDDISEKSLFYVQLNSSVLCSSPCLQFAEDKKTDLKGFSEFDLMQICYQKIVLVLRYLDRDSYILSHMYISAWQRVGEMRLWSSDKLKQAAPFMATSVTGLKKIGSSETPRKPP